MIVLAISQLVDDFEHSSLPAEIGKYQSYAVPPTRAQLLPRGLVGRSDCLGQSIVIRD